MASTIMTQLPIASSSESKHPAFLKTKMPVRIKAIDDFNTQYEHKLLMLLEKKLKKKIDIHEWKNNWLKKDAHLHSYMMQNYIFNKHEIINHH